MIPINPCEHLARIGFDHLLGENGSLPNNEDDSFSIENARLADHRFVCERLLESKPKPIAGERKNGVTWVDMRITWPDRVPGLVTWSGNQTLDKLIKKYQEAIKGVKEDFDLFTLQIPIKGTSGLDILTCLDAIDIGFSPDVLDMPVHQRPGLELLAIVGMELVPAVSWGYRACGFVDNDVIYRFEVESRTGGYYHRWGYINKKSFLEKNVVIAPVKVSEAVRKDLVEIGESVKLVEKELSEGKVVVASHTSNGRQIKVAPDGQGFLVQPRDDNYWIEVPTLDDAIAAFENPAAFRKDN